MTHDYLSWAVNMFSLLLVLRPNTSSTSCRFWPPPDPVRTGALPRQMLETLQNTANNKKRASVSFPRAQTKECFNGAALRGKMLDCWRNSITA